MSRHSRIWKAAFRKKAELRAKQLSAMVPGHQVPVHEAEWRHAALQQHYAMMASISVSIAINEIFNRELAEAKTKEERDAAYANANERMRKNAASVGIDLGELPA